VSQQQWSGFTWNPRCSKSRAALELLRERGIDPEVRDYLHQPPTIAELQDLMSRLGTGARSLLRSGEAEYAALGLDDPSLDDAALLAAMAAHPRLIERPIFINGARAIIGRPPERVLELLG
jgi:arsenate reductase